MKRSSYALACVLLGLFFVCALYISWMLLAQGNFFYSLWHQLFLGDHIAQYAPQNHFGKADFVLTTLAQRQDAFAAIVDAIHLPESQARDALSRIQYSTPHTTQSLLTEAEITHLVDVARLVYVFNQTGLASVGLALGLCAWLLWKRTGVRIEGRMVIVCALLVSVLIAMVLFVGATEVFYWLHTLLFPAQHQWFFYYQDSLMSTMMAAPLLFLCIAPIWLGVTGACLIFFVTGWNRTFRVMTRRATRK